MNYKNHVIHEVISESDYRLLPYEKRKNFYVSSERPSHTINSDDMFDYLIPLAIISAFDDDDVNKSYDSDHHDYDNDFTAPSGDDSFGGGDFGGGGAGGDW